MHNLPLSTAGVDIPEEGPVKVKGALTFPKPIVLFKAFGDQITVFKMPTIKIPIPGAAGNAKVDIMAQMSGDSTSN